MLKMMIIRENLQFITGSGYSLHLTAHGDPHDLVIKDPVFHSEIPFSSKMYQTNSVAFSLQVNYTG
jgi:hypothetical protein